MTSYFDIPKSTKVKPDGPNEKGGSAFKQMGMMTPEVNRILNDMELEEHSSSDSESNASKEKATHKEQQHDPPQALVSPMPGKKQANRDSPRRPGLGAGGGKEKHQHLARFHSLRSMLFLSKIEDKMTECNEVHAKSGSEDKWKAEHEQRQGLNRPKTPESPKGSPTKEGFAHRMGDKLRRITSKDVPTMKNIKEDDNESTASDDEDDTHRARMRADGESDTESIKHSDVEDLVRWISRRDPPSDGETRALKQHVLNQRDSGHESLGHSDVEDLIRWVSRREAETEAEADVEEKEFNYSDPSTESDSGGGAGSGSDSMDDAEDLVRWVSRKEGPKAGPVHEPRAREHNTKHRKIQDDYHSEHTDFSEGGELSRWVTRKDDTSGESDNPGHESVSKPTSGSKKKERGGERGSLAQHDVDELVRWITNREEKLVKGGGVGKEAKSASRPREGKATLTQDDVDELVKWVSRREASAEEEVARDDNIMKWTKEQDEQQRAADNLKLKQEEDKKKESLGMSQDKGSLQPDQVDELVQWVSQR